eukprot:TRINITY_DN11248_c0_g1_i1.p1 TRINITY_DN11248_c0_g1~~TRINITY_DN11248_c0_g1_i1.p1  ORF type:complete len:384 (+),score=65.66 TRINITY_DN11248_c0_g1_i1:110-1261(+)
MACCRLLKTCSLPLPCDLCAPLHQQRRRIAGSSVSLRQTRMKPDAQCSFEIPVEVVTEEEMACIEEALRMSTSTSPPVLRDIEDSPLHRHCLRRHKALSVTDITASEWCEKQMELSVIHGRPRKTSAMKAGTARHTELEKEVIQRVELEVCTQEDFWAVQLMNFICGANQLIINGLTRELPLITLVDGVWVFGILDEVRMCDLRGTKKPMLIDTKTRSKASIPSEAQKRNARLQLMCYKLLWDNIVNHEFPSTSFFQYFGLQPECLLSRDIRKHIRASGVGTMVRKLDDLIVLYKNTCESLPLSHETLIVRYELQADRSLLSEEEFFYEETWVEKQVQWHLQFWLGKREASLVPEIESWKCHHCAFSSRCPKGDLLIQEQKAP